MGTEEKDGENQVRDGEKQLSQLRAEGTQFSPPKATLSTGHWTCYAQVNTDHKSTLKALLLLFPGSD